MQLQYYMYKYIYYKYTLQSSAYSGFVKDKIEYFLYFLPCVYSSVGKEDFNQSNARAGYSWILSNISLHAACCIKDVFSIFIMASQPATAAAILWAYSQLKFIAQFAIIFGNILTLAAHFPTRERERERERETLSELQLMLAILWNFHRLICICNARFVI